MGHYDNILPKEFFARDARVVARELLGQILVRVYKNNVLAGKIVETEAYLGKEDPASVARRSKVPYSELMWGEPGVAFIYAVHGNWLLNIVTMPKGVASAVLIRAIEPIEGIEIMMENRKVTDIKNLTNGPGKLTKALAIDKRFNGVDVTKQNSPIKICRGSNENFEIVKKHRIGVSKDLREPLRFYIKDNKFVSKK